MTQLKQWIVLFCGLLLALQGFASAVSPSLPSSQNKMHHAMSDATMGAHCHMSAQKHDGKLPKCCSDHCADMANCFSQTGLISSLSLRIVPAPALAPPTHRAGGFVSPDPDFRLRPPDSLLV